MNTCIWDTRESKTLTTLRQKKNLRIILIQNLERIKNHMMMNHDTLKYSIYLFKLRS